MNSSHFVIGATIAIIVIIVILILFSKEHKHSGPSRYYEPSQEKFSISTTGANTIASNNALDKCTLNEIYNDSLTIPKGSSRKYCKNQYNVSNPRGDTNQYNGSQITNIASGITMPLTVNGLPLLK